MSRLLDVIGCYLLSVVAGLGLEYLGFAGHFMAIRPWRPLHGSLLDKAGEILSWSLPHALLGAIVVVPALLIGVVRRLRRS